MRKIYAPVFIGKRFLFVIIGIFSLFVLKAQTIITTLPNPPYNGGNSLGGPAQVTFVVDNTNSSGIFLTGISNYCTSAENNSVWKLYYSPTSLSGVSADVTSGSWNLVATSAPTPVTATGIAPLNFAGLNFSIPGNTQYRFALRNEGVGSMRYSGTGVSISPNSFTGGGVNLYTGDFKIGGLDVGWSGTGVGVTLNPRYFTGEISFIPATACTGTPAGGNAQSSVASVCNPTTPFVLSVANATAASGLTYQWQSSANNISWTDITAATSAIYNVTSGITANTYYRRRITCGTNSSFSASVFVTVTAPSYATLPFTESFESSWIDGCDTKDIPNNFWRNTPATGNQSWRRNDDGASAGWTTVLGTYTPDASAGSFSARFHSYNAPANSKGRMELFVNCNTTAAGKRLNFDYINTDGSDSLVVFVSNNGGSSFTRIDSVRTSTVWKTKSLIFSSTSAATIIRFETTSDDGLSDIGIDNISIAELANCTGATVGGTASATAGNTCGLPFTLSVAGSTDPVSTFGIALQWQQSTDGGTTWTNIPGATGADYSSTGIFVATQYRRAIVCAATAITSYSTVATIAGNSPTYATLPFTESFENSWLSVCDVNDAPNNSWRNSPVTGNQSWRRNDDGATANWTAAATGLYIPNASVGTFSARFHTYFAPSGSKGQLNLYLNAATAVSAKRLSFDFINLDGTDSLVVFLSTNNGASFTRLDSVRTSTIWKTKSIFFTSTSAQTIIRFETTSDFGSGTAADIGLDNVNIVDFPNCSGTPSPGTATASAASNCTSTPFTLTVTGASEANNITYQWQSSPDGTTWTNIAGATGAAYNSPGINASTQFRRVIFCGANSSNSTSVTVSVIPVSYTTLPYTESFENTWSSICNNRDVPNTFWRNLPSTGFNSWRRNDDGLLSGAWTNVLGNYTPEASAGTYSARFHSYQTTTGQKGSLNLYVNAATGSPTKRLQFDFINTIGADSLSILLSTNGGTSFVRLDSAGVAAAWRTKTIVFTSTSATTVIRFEATGLVFSSDIGLDNINLVDFPACAGTPTGGTTTSGNSTVCPSAPFALSVTGATDAQGITYQWQSSPDGVAWTNITGATAALYNSAGITTTTYYRRQILCGANSSFSASMIIALNNPVYVTLPYAESFENTWISGCGLREIPNNSWRNIPVTGNNSWRRNDDQGAAGWVNPDLGEYNPDASDGQFSARFHSYQASGGTKGQLNLYVNAATTSATKRLNFDYINISGSDTLSILLSTNGGTSFTRLDSAGLSTLWKTKSIVFTSSSATTIIRFEATSDFGVTDIGLDNILLTDFAPCVGAPNAGTAISSSLTVCSESFTLSLQGSTSAAGITYQWQRAPSATGPWTDISGATNFTYTTAQTGTFFYRAIVSCGSESSSSVPVQVISPSLVSGMFTINNSLATTIPTNFNNFNDAYNYIKCGINGPVVFNVVNNAAGVAGFYNEQLVMASIPGASIVNTITFKGRGSTIGFSATNTNERAVIKLRGADYIRFDSLIINAGAGTFGYGIQLLSNADSNMVTNCIINTNNTATTTNYAGIVISGTEAGPIATGTVLCDYNTFSNNTINGGFAGFTLAATLTGANLNNRYINNTVNDFYLYGIYVNGSSGTIIEGNVFARPTRATVSDFNGIYFTGISTRANISKNRITNPFGGALTSTNAFNGILFTGVDATTDNENIVANNLIAKLNGLGVHTGISNTSSDNAWYFHNTISIDSAASTSTSASRGFFQTTLAGGILFFNNMVTISRGGIGAKHAIYMATNTTGFAADYNNYFLSAPAGSNFIGFSNAINRSTLNDWRAATNQDANSLSRNPFYNNPSALDYKPTNGAVDNKGTDAGINTDILNVSRNSLTPDIGAYEFVALPCTLPPDPGSTTFNDTTVCQNSPVRLNLTVTNWGATQTFQWQTATTAAGPWTNMGGLTDDPDTTIIATTSLFFRSAVTCGGSTVFSNAIQLLVSPALPAGTYTINKGGTNTYVPGVAGGNFVSFNDAKAAMGCGITGGPVVFNVTPGATAYNEQLRLDSIPGASVINTITFNGNGNTISLAATGNTERAIIKLSGADHIIFDSLRIDASAGTTYGYGVQLQDNADSNTFRKCIIISSLTSASTNYAGVIINASETGAVTTGATFSDGNTFDRNTITGGYYGVTLMGGTTATTYINNNRFTNNTIQEFYNYGFYFGGTFNTLIEGNIFTRPTRTNTAASVYGIFATAAVSSRPAISKNRLTKFFGGIVNNTATFYGIYHNSVDANAGNEVVVSNNLIYGLEGNAPMYGLYNVSSNNVFYYHNTISFDNSASTATGATAGLYQTTAATGIFFRNNIITIRRGGTGTKHAVYMNTVAGTEISASNNNYFVQGNNAHVGFRTTNQTTLAQWQTATSQDANSFNLNPLYADTVNGNYRPQITGLDNKGVFVNITADILNVTRNTATPDIGAYEFAPIACQTPPVAGTASVTPASGVCLETPITLTTAGHSPLGNITFQWQNSPDGTGSWTNISGVQFFPEFDTITTVNRFYRAAVTCNGVTTYTNVVSVNLNPLLLSGTYTINQANTTGGTNFQSFQDAVTAMLCGITGPVVFNIAPGTYNEKLAIPYIRNTSAVNTVTFQSATGVANSAILSAAGTTADNYTLRLDSTRWFTFRNMSFTATDAFYGRAVVLQNEASNNSFVNNTINLQAVTTASNNVVGIYANAFKGSNILLRNNTINNGSKGVHLAGTSLTVLALPGHLIDSNTINDAYNYGIYTEFTKGLKVMNNKVSSTSAMAANSAGIYANYADTAFRLTGNSVAMNGNTGTTAYGIYVLNSRSLKSDSSIVAGNKFSSDSNNTGTIYGLTIASSKSVNAVNNLIAINNAGTTAYGLYSLNNTDDINYFNNSVNLGTTAANGYAGYFNHTAAAGTTVNNNIFSNKGGGRALYINNPASFNADYNLLHTTGANLVQVATGATLNFADLKAWTSAWNWDRYSISYSPAFISNLDLRPNLANPDVWAMHGRGTQIKGNTYDFNNNRRPDSLRAGVPDLGAYEFFPTAQPTVLLATPSVPAPNSTQTFSYGTDTVMKITWGPSAPPTVSVRRFSGVVPSGLLPTQDSMYFYTKVDVGGTNNYQYNAKLYYINPWQGSIPQQYMIGLGRTLPSNAWVVGQNSKVDVGKKEIRQDGLVYMDRFTGLLNPDARPENDDSSSNRGKDFWVGYQRTNGFGGNTAAAGSQNMVIYMGAGDQPANVTITIQGTAGTPWVRTYAVPANTTLTSETLPKLGAADARLFAEGKYDKKGIHIESNVPIVAYAHIYESTNSGATMLMPSTVWGYEYYTLTSRQNYSPVTGFPSSSVFHIVAQHDSTLVEINPSAPTLNGWVPNGGPFNGNYRVTLNKGDAYQVLGAILSGNEGHDLTGSYIKSIGGSQGCFPIAVFAGSTRTGIGCGTSAGGSGDLIIQQIFPYQAWGTKYLVAPTSNATGPTATSNMNVIYRVMVKDPTTIVKRNNVVLTGLLNSRYYQFESSAANGDYIESNKPVLVAEYMSSNGSCPNTGADGDPEMFYISPVEQAIKKTQFYRNNLTAIDENFITLVIPTEGLQSLRIDGVNYLSYAPAERFVTAHTNPGFSIVTKRWAAGAGSSTVESDFAFTGIVYGIGSVESYGYNLGTLVKNLNNLSSVNTVLNSTGNTTGYTCRGAQFRITALLPIVPDSIRFNISAVPGIQPNANVTLRGASAIPTDTVDVNGVTYYAYTLSTAYTLDSAGTFTIPISYWSQEIESCDKRKDGSLTVQVLPKPITDFKITYANAALAACQGDVVNLQGDLITSNGIALNQWQWTFAPGGSQATATGQAQTISYAAAGSYAVKLRGVTADGCVSDTTKNVIINAKPVVTLINANTEVCPGTNASWTISNPITGAVYNWYSAATGGALLGTGTTFTLTNATPPVSVWVAATANGCTSVTRLEAKAILLGPLTPANVRVLSRDVNTVTFTWDPVALANPASYMVSVRGGAFIPANGLPNLTHIVTGLRPTDTVSIRVMAIGSQNCQSSTSPSVTGQTLPDQIYIPNSFSPNGDNLNDVLLVYGYVIRDMQIAVFNQWGEKIFESRNQSMGWDGRHKGKAQPSGVYLYVAKFVLRDGSTIERKGAINLVR